MEPMTQNNVPQTASQAASAPVTPKGDTYSYKGWLISDSFIKRALAAVGYNFVGGLILYIPFLIIFLIFGFSMLAMFGFSERGSRHDDTSYGEIMNEIGGVDLEQMCRDSLAYTTLPEGVDEEAYIADCMGATDDDSDMPMRNRYR